MSAYQLHLEGDCGFSCPVCAAECDTCGEWLHECACATTEPDEEES